MIRLTGDWPRIVQDGATAYLIENYEFFSSWELEKIEDLITQIYDTFSHQTTENVQLLFDNKDLEEDRDTLLNMCIQLEALSVLREILLMPDSEKDLPPVGLKNSRKNIRRIK